MKSNYLFFLLSLILLLKTQLISTKRLKTRRNLHKKEITKKNPFLIDFMKTLKQGSSVHFESEYINLLKKAVKEEKIDFIIPKLLHKMYFIDKSIVKTEDLALWSEEYLKCLKLTPDELNNRRNTPTICITFMENFNNFLIEEALKKSIYNEINLKLEMRTQIILSNSFNAENDEKSHFYYKNLEKEQIIG